MDTIVLDDGIEYAIVREDENLQKALNSLSDDAAVMAKQTM